MWIERPWSWRTWRRDSSGWKHTPTSRDGQTGDTPWLWWLVRSGRPEPLHAHFDVTDLDQEGVDTLLRKMQDALSGEERPNVILAALVELSAQYLSAAPAGESETSANGKELAS